MDIFYTIHLVKQKLHFTFLERAPYHDTVKEHIHFISATHIDDSRTCGKTKTQIGLHNIPQSKA